ncbi:histidine phosphatase family protein [Jannaschia sp. 2305UL9-9]|uniref:histidine phosphatase family protein n=1 Tax=Jannaschia sp. 2305UL9-9 TaxID=3121638 RepID=UPI003527F839
MTRLWLIRHGPTHARRMVGWTDLPADLSDTPAIERLSAALPHAPVVSSDLIRATATADAIQGTRPRLPHSPALREFHYGEWENQAFDAIDSPDLRAYFDDPGARRAPGGESWDDVAARVHGAVGSMAGGTDLIVVAHMGVILTLWARARGIPPYDALAQRIDNLSLTRIDWSDGRLSAVDANRCP